MSGEAKTLRDSAFCALLIAFCGVLAMYLPPLFLVASIALPALPALLTVRRHVLAASGALALAAVVLGLALAPQGVALVTQAELFLIVPMGLSGLLLGLIFKNRLSLSHGLLAALAGQFVFTGGAWAWFWGLTGYNPFSSTGLQAALNEVIAMYLKTGGSAAAPTLTSFARLMVFLWPGIQVAGLAVQMGATYLWTRYLLIRQGNPVPVVLPFSFWHLPWQGIWSLIAGLGFMLAGSEFGWAPAYRMGGNLLYVVGQVYLVVGIAVLAFYFRRLQGMTLLKILLVLALVIDPQVGAPLLVVVGVLDSIVNLRRKPGKTS